MIRLFMALHNRRLDVRQQFAGIEDRKQFVAEFSDAGNQCFGRRIAGIFA